MVSLISKHHSPTIATALGHHDQEAKHFCPTKPSMTEVKINQPDMDLAPAAKSHTNIICSMVFSTESFRSYSDQTGRFLVRSSWGNLYMFVLYHYDTNTIHVIAIPNCQAATIWDAWLKTYNILFSKGYQIQHHILDNECSQHLKAEFFNNNINYQLVPQAEQWVNVAEHLVAHSKTTSLQYWAWLISTHH